MEVKVKAIYSVLPFFTVRRKSVLQTKTVELNPWKGTDVCDSGNGCYPAAVFYEGLEMCTNKTFRKS